MAEKEPAKAGILWYTFSDRKKGVGFLIKNKADGNYKCDANGGISDYMWSNRRTRANQTPFSLSQCAEFVASLFNGNGGDIPYNVKTYIEIVEKCMPHIQDKEDRKLIEDKLSDLKSKLNSDLDLEVDSNKKKIYMLAGNIMYHLDRIDREQMKSPRTVVKIVGTETEEDEATPEGRKSQAVERPRYKHPTGFFGRENDVKRVKDSLDKNRIVVVCGVSGIGKTQLCEEICSSQHYSKSYRIYTRGVFAYTELIKAIALQSDCDPDIETKAAECENIEAFIRSTENRIVKYFRDREPSNSERNVLYLDNLEDVLKEEGIFDRLSSLLSRLKEIPRLDILISSVQTISGWANVDISALVHSEAEKLFDTVYYRLKGNGAVSEEEKAEISQFVQILGGHPLAIVLCASNAACTSVRDTRKQWELEDAKVDIPADDLPSHRSLSLAMQFTWDHVKDDPDVCLIWAILAFVSRELEGQVLEEFFDAAQLNRARTNMSKLSLVSLESDSIDMLEPVKKQIFQYDRNAVLNAEKLLTKYYAEMLSAFNGYSEDSMREILKKSGDIMLLLSRLYEDKQMELFYDLAGCRNGMWEVSKERWDQMHSICKCFLDKNANPKIEKIPPVVHELMLNCMAYYEQRQNGGDLSKAIIYLEKSLDICKDENDTQEMAFVYRRLGDVYRRDNRPDADILQLYEKAGQLSKECDDWFGYASALHQIGDCRFFCKMLDEANQCYNEALTLFEEHKDIRDAAHMCESIGDIAKSRGDLKSAGQHYQDAETKYSKIGASYKLSAVRQKIEQITRLQESI